MPTVLQFSATYDYSCMVTLPEGLVFIGNYEFHNCFKLKNISFPSTLKYIGAGAFLTGGSNTHALRTVTLPVKKLL